jgi:glycosyltransferase involved in cell wall biosynthesis
MARKLYIAIHYRDIFGLNHAVPAEAKAVARALAKHSELVIIGRDQTNNLTVDGSVCLTYGNRRELWNIISGLNEKKIDALILQAPLTIDAIITLLFCAILGLPVVVEDFGQITRAALGRRLFTQNPDVRSLEASGTTRRSNWFTKASNLSSSIQKGMALALMRILRDRCIKGWITFSSFSKHELSLLIGVDDSRCVDLPWPAEQIKQLPEAPNWFESSGMESGVFRFVLWSRLDYWMKGIDRLLEGFSAACGRSDEFKRVARLYLIGPDYQGGGDETLKHIERLAIADNVEWLGPEKYPKGSLQPLKDADASVLLSRWDGFPRALRESLGLGVPVVVSPETHFCDLVTAYDCGESISNADDPECIASGLLNSFKESYSIRQSGRPMQAHASLHGDAIGLVAAAQLQGLLGVGNDIRP